MFSELSIKDFFLKLSSDSPTPGGGTVSCIAGSFGAGLIAMSIGISSRKFMEEQERAKGFHEKLMQVSEELFHLSDEDSLSFDKVMEAYRLPKATEDEKVKRKLGIENALKAATITPLKLLRKINEIEPVADYAFSILSENVMSDFITGVCLLQGALYGGYANVMINLSGIKDRSFAEEVSKEAEEIFNTQLLNLALLKDSAMNKLKGE